MHTPGKWSIKYRPTREGECGPGLWIEGSNHRTVCDTGAYDVFPLKNGDRALIENAAVMAQLLADFVEGTDLAEVQAKASVLLVEMQTFA